jgi:nascent polypeptide-associated complex subunit alpha|eukprot:CAMPEP_0174312190 /NCGR_PEP_ID=MMETSP0810-20121108/4139_1 /TAXON_ID=73025 ORGANISM="Eutreptiella gymnastica-like, Strain CCMP1594" /NCGR_SAMPLE_ID=MMETSP0810 /ASSEMBLY_ACC=CAM_ASM_000659 /LENGTH=400 /DNA_ID=CAMNT_0015420529 /DNA_START=29 /DNA_END=1231 /DNA_ORIENTATION=-
MAGESEINRESNTKSSFDFWKGQKDEGEGKSQETTNKAKDYFAQDDVQKNMKQSKSFWSQKEQEVKKDAESKPKASQAPKPKKETKQEPVRQPASATASTAPAPKANTTQDEQIQKESNVKSAFARFQSGAPKQDSPCRQTSKQAQEYLQSDEVKANWSAKTQFWQAEVKKMETQIAEKQQQIQSKRDQLKSDGKNDEQLSKEIQDLEEQVESMEEKKEGLEMDMKDKEGSDEDDDDVPALEAAETPIAQPSFDGLRGRQTRTEKKSRKAMQKIGMKPVSGVVRVTIKKSKDIVFVISQPDVYKSPTTDTYIIFGEARMEDTASEIGKKAMQSFAPDEAAASAPVDHEDDDDTEDVDAGNLDPKDIELVMSQASVSRNRAIKALAHNDGDIVNAIMELTM